MALNKATLAQAIQAALDDESDKEVNPAEARARMAANMADAIDTYIRAGVVTVEVKTTGSAAAQAGIGTGTIS